MTSNLVDNRLSDIDTTDSVIRRLAIWVMVAISAIAVTIFMVHQFWHNDPYVQSVLELQGDPVKGHAIFQMNCSSCHGLYADGSVGPSLKSIAGHRSPARLIHQVVSGKTPPMPQFQPSPQEMADLLQYLEQL